MLVTAFSRNDFFVRFTKNFNLILFLLQRNTRPAFASCLRPTQNGQCFDHCAATYSLPTTDGVIATSTAFVANQFKAWLEDLQECHFGLSCLSVKVDMNKDAKQSASHITHYSIRKVLCCMFVHLNFCSILGVAMSTKKARAMC